MFLDNTHFPIFFASNTMFRRLDSVSETEPTQLGPIHIHQAESKSCYIPSTQPGFRCLYSCCYMAWAVQWLRLALSKGRHRIGVSLPSPEDGNRSSFHNIVFSSYLEFRTMDAFYELRDSECCTCTPSSELFRC
jgi:hypothetical protein